ncbi:MAG: tetratricopeptide repeat protein [Xanthomonadaceae bacterium]|nr:tetratricopeptide repeat protein [Xanthomonadaceae bacterium]
MSTQKPDKDVEKTVVGRSESKEAESDKTQVQVRAGSNESSVSYDQTKVFTKEEKQNRVLMEQGEIEKNPLQTVNQNKTFKLPGQTKTIIMGILALIMISEWFEDEDPVIQKASYITPKPYKVSLPSYSSAPADPADSKKNFELGLRLYARDNPQAYKKAAVAFLKATSQDIKNTKALALLASTYLNLIDASTRDENYFAVINKLVEMSKAKTASSPDGLESPEVLIAEVEFFLAMKRADAAQSKILEYTKKVPNYGSEIYFYSALAAFEKADYSDAAKYLNQLGDTSVMGPRLFFLRGHIAEKLDQTEEALKEFRKAVRIDPDHGKSVLKIASIQNSNGKLTEAKPLLDRVIERPELLFPVDLSQALYLRARAYEIEKKWKKAYGDIQVAVAIDPNNTDYLFEYYTIRSEVFSDKEDSNDVKSKAKMYGFLSIGEKLYSKGKFTTALDEFLKARNSDMTSTAPLIRIGDVFQKLGDFRNASINYKKAIDLARNDSSIQAKYADALIKGFEWEAAKTALERLQKMKNAGFLYFKLMGQFFTKQGQITAALSYYKQAMGVGRADPEAYIGYANLLLDQKNCTDAPFFYSMALRVDPLNREAMIGMARCHVQLDSIDRGISFLQEEIQKVGSSSAGLLTAIAELQLQKGDTEQALQYLEQAEAIDSSLVEILKLKGQVYLSKSSRDKKSLQKALEYFALYSEKNPGDPTGYMERYKIYLKKRQFEYASQELDKVLITSPKYPGLREAKAELHLAQGNRQMAIDELEAEVKNTPGNPKSRLALAKIMIDAGELQRATIQLEEAMRLDQESAEIKYHMGLVYLMRRNFVPAVVLFKGAIQTDPGNPEIYRELAKAYMGLSDRENATKTLLQYEERSPDAKDLQELQRLLK